ncbi:MAG: acetyl-CoA C-acetyltransferase [Bdellovibrionota bacterium]
MTKSSGSGLVFLSAKRTPFGAFGGGLKDVNPSDLGASCAKAALEQAKIGADQVEHVIVGNVLQSTGDAICVARHIGLKAGVPIEIAALGVNRLCGSGFQVLVEAQHQMWAEDAKVCLVGGVENMSLTPYVLRNARWGNRMGHAPVEDYLTAALTDTYCSCSMAMTAENLGEKYGITRAQADEFALSSQMRAKAAQEAGAFADEISPYSITDKKGTTVRFEKDEHPKPATTLEALAKLKAGFKQNGLVTAGNASGIVDGASMMVVSTEEYARKNNLKPLGRLVSYGIAGVEPHIMGIGPAPAARQALKRAGLSLSQMDLVEVNEAFAAQYLSVEKELELDREITNVNGGAIAIGHPLAASGTRITAHLLYELRRRKKRYALGSACIGGGQGIAVIVEAL